MLNKKNTIKLRYRLSPLCFMPDGTLLAYRFGKIYFLRPNNLKITKSIRVTCKLKEIIVSAIPILYRLLRLGVRIAFPIDSEKALLFYDKKMVEFNVEKLTLSNGCRFQDGVRPLKISQIKDVPGFTDMIVFGGYLGNQLKNPVHIYRRVMEDKWEIIYTFPSGAINHIHNIVPDVDNECVYIFTGDFDHSAAIWKATNNFKEVNVILSNDQKFRGCIAFPTQKGLLYATDSPFLDNSIRLLTFNNQKWESKLIKNIHGSCIYGCKVGEKFVFSTAVEGDGRNQTLLNLFTSQKRGAGIKDDSAHLYIGDVNNGFKNIYSVKKDLWPFAFQFGVIKFPEGVNKTNALIVEHVATKNDLKSYAIFID